MASYFLDTNTCVYALKGSFAGIERRLRGLSPDDVKIPSIVTAELLLGAEKSEQRKRTLEAIRAFLVPYESVPFCALAAEQYARIRAELERRGQPVGPNDLIVAATVLAHHGVLVSHNTREFRRVKGLRLEDWATR
jgi:tRNA(fMet)-specific endonuclease VapC